MEQLGAYRPLYYAELIQNTQGQSSKLSLFRANIDIFYFGISSSTDNNSYENIVNVMIIVVVESSFFLGIA